MFLEDFEICSEFVNQMQFANAHIFTYSPRPGTPAAGMEDPTPKEEKNRRFDKLCAVQNSISETLHAGYVGKTLRCLIDGTDKTLLTARTEGGRLVRFKGDPALIGTYTPITITGATTWSLLGEIREKD